MIYDSCTGNITIRRSKLIEFLKKRREADPSFTCIDVGGSVSGWSTPYVDAIVDFNAPSIETSVNVFVGNINKTGVWDSVLAYVAEHGKYNFVICSHTLEDISNPELTLSMLPRIAIGGYVAVPSKYNEMAHIEGPWRGYIHHRWIYTIENNALLGFPKLSFIEHIPKLHVLANSSPMIAELSFYWDGSIEYGFVNNDYLGPSVQHVISYYNRLLDS